METPLDQETANADLISDIVASRLHQSTDVSDLARDLTSTTSSWREAWSVGTQDAGPPEDPVLTSPLLSYAEDEELRRLNYLAEIGTLAGVKAERLIELRLRDRRGEVRAPRETVEESLDARTKRRWYQFRSR